MRVCVCRGGGYQSLVLLPMPVTLALGKQRLENHEFEAVLGYIVSSHSAWVT